MSSRQNLAVTPNVTSSPGWEPGRMSCASPDGLTTGLFGRVPAPANRGRRRANAKEQPTVATSGPHGSGSSVSAALQRFLARTLRARLPAAGSMEYSLTWKEKVTDAGRPYCLLRASGHRTSDTGCSGWPSPRVADTQNESIETKRKRNARHLATSLSTSRTKGVGGLTLPMTATLAGWPTPNVPNRGCESAESKANRPDAGGIDLQSTVTLAGWPTPMAGTPKTETYNEAGNTDSGRKTVELLAGWATPAARDWRDGRSNQHGKNARPLNEVAVLAGWGTPGATDGSNGGPNRDDQSALPPQVSGLTASPSSAETGKSGGSPPRLNVYFSAWLIGLPAAWVTCCLKAVSRSRARSKGGRRC